MELNERAIIMISLSLTAAGGLMFVQGCDLRSLIHIDVPKDVAVAIDLPEGKLTLQEADAVWLDWSQWVTQNNDRFATAIDDGNVRYEKLNQFISMGTGVLGQFSNGIPYGGLLFGALTGVSGLLLPQPTLARKSKPKV